MLFRSVETFGVDHQLWVFVGEVAELLDDVADYKRGRCTVDDIAEEIADVEIMLEQLKVIYQCYGAVAYWRQAKTERLKGYIEKEVDKDGLSTRNG